MEALLVAPAAAVLAPLLGALLAGADRKVSARMQGRYGPPVVQPVYDVIKLLGKEGKAVNPWPPVCAALYLFGALASVTVFAAGGHLLVVFFLSTFTATFFIAGAQAVPSPYSRLGAGRELLQVLAYEPVLLLVFAGFHEASGSFYVYNVLAHTAFPILRMPLAFVSLFVVLLVKLRKSPLDIASSAHAHQELVRGTLTEYSGPSLALVEAGHWCETVLLLMVFALFAGSSTWGALLLPPAAYLAALVVDNVAPRLTWRWMLRRIWPAALLAAFSNLLWLHWVGV